MGTKTVEQRFFEKVNKTLDCWNWTGSTNVAGFGKLAVNGKFFTAHRFILILKGHTIDETVRVFQKCKNAACVKPSHLEVVEVKGKK